MQGKCLFLLLTVLTASSVFPTQAKAYIVISEFLADPASGNLGDSNNDGVRSSSDDEFVELLNLGGDSVDLTGWRMSDSSSLRHIFPVNSMIDPYHYLVVFGGGGSINLPGINWQTASSGAFGLNNSGDTITLRDAYDEIVYDWTYGSEGGDNQSLALFPEGEGMPFVKHTEIPEAAGALFSPGQSTDGRLTSQQMPVVPEWPTFAQFLLMSLSVIGIRNCRRFS